METQPAPFQEVSSMDNVAAPPVGFVRMAIDTSDGEFVKCKHSDNSVRYLLTEGGERIRCANPIT